MGESRPAAHWPRRSDRSGCLCKPVPHPPSIRTSGLAYRSTGEAPEAIVMNAATPIGLSVETSGAADWLKSDHPWGPTMASSNREGKMIVSGCARMSGGQNLRMAACRLPTGV
jgi:hypothetical protein